MTPIGDPITPVSTPRVIKSMTGGGGISDELLECYFLRDENGKYNFYSKHGHLKGGDLQVGSLLAFQLEGQHFAWALYIDDISEKEVTGKWANTAPKIAQDEGGTFTAQAGGNVDAETASSANA